MAAAEKKKFGMQTSVIHHYLQIFNKEQLLFSYVSNNKFGAKRQLLLPMQVVLFLILERGSGSNICSKK